MKVSQEEIEAALSAFHKKQTDLDYSLRRAIKAALTVRRARKKAKRERQRKEKDKQVVESAKNSLMSAQLEVLAAYPMNGYGGVEPTPSKDPEWDGTFYLGQWQTREGSKVVLSEVDHHPVYPFTSEDGRTYDKSGFLYSPNTPTPHDLIRPWPKGEQ